jgi:hypothetical protein
VGRTQQATDLVFEVLREMAADDAVLDELLGAARAESPVVGRLPVREGRRHVAVLLAAGLAALRRGAEPDDGDLDAATRLGADRAAQGIPLSALLGAMQASRTRALEIAIQRGRTAGLPDETLLWVLPELDRSTAALERGVINGYQAAERRLAHDRGRALRRLLRGEGATAEELGVRAEQPYHCVVATPGDRAELGCVLTTAIDGHLAGLAARPPAGPVTGVVVVAPAGTLAEAAERYPACVAALATAGEIGVHDLLDLAADVALSGQPMLAGLLTGTLLAGLRPDDEFHRELVATALAYLDHGRRLDQTAAALFVHPNTVRYRLRRLRELAGPAAEPTERMTMREAVRLWWALRQWGTWPTGTSATGEAMGLPRRPGPR